MTKKIITSDFFNIPLYYQKSDLHNSLAHIVYVRKYVSTHVPEVRKYVPTHVPEEAGRIPCDKCRH